MIYRVTLLVVLAGLALAITRRDERFWCRMFHARVPLAGIGAYLLLPCAAQFGGNATLEGTFAQAGFWEIAAVLIAGVAAVETCLLAVRLIWRAGKLRFADLREIDDPLEFDYVVRMRTRPVLSVTNLGWVALLSTPFLSGTVMLSLEHGAPLSPAAAWGAGALGVVLGWLFSVSLDVAHSVLQRRLEAAGTLDGLKRFFSRRAPAFRDGYWYPDEDEEEDPESPGHWVEGHLLAALGFSILFAAFQSAALLHPARSFGASVPALCYVMLLMIVLVAFLSGASFFLDRLRIPLALGAAAAVFAAFMLSDRDHYFGVLEAGPDEAAATERLATAKAALGARLESRGESARKNRAIVVCAAGGGIQAAAWTARVLTELDALSQRRFSSELVCLSGVSGGSVGSMYFLEAARLGPIGEGEAARVRSASARSSLAAVLWGWALKDVQRGIPLFWSRGVQDRGWALEQSWSSAMPWPGFEQTPLSQASLLKWSESAVAGDMPAVFFNATVAETGGRQLFSNVHISGVANHAQISVRRGADRDNELVSTALRSNAVLEYGYDVPILTAVRMSSTFPYVTPMARPAVLEEGVFGTRVKEVVAVNDRSASHLADGGYFDNLGLVTAIEWLRELDAVLHEAGVSEVALVSVMPFPDEIENTGSNAKSLAEALVPDSVRAGLGASIVGPLGLVMQVRVSTQLDRAALERELIVDANLKVPIQSFVVRPVRGSAVGPMNWHLTRKQTQAVEADWERLLGEAQAADGGDAKGLAGLLRWLKRVD